MRGTRSKIIGYDAKSETIGQTRRATAILKRKKKRDYMAERNAKVIKPVVSKRQQRLTKQTSNF